MSNAPEEVLTRAEAVQVAKELLARGERRAELVKWLHEEDMLGLECAQTVELEKLGSLDARDGWRLAKWLVFSELEIAGATK